MVPCTAAWCVSRLLMEEMPFTPEGYLLMYNFIKWNTARILQFISTKVRLSKMVISFTKLLRETQQFYVFLWRQHVKKKDHLKLDGCKRGEERKGQVSAGNFKLAVHRVLGIEVIELSIWYKNFSVFHFFCVLYFPLPFTRSIRDWRSVRVYV